MVLVLPIGASVMTSARGAGTRTRLSEVGFAGRRFGSEERRMAFAGEAASQLRDRVTKPKCLC